MLRDTLTLQLGSFYLFPDEGELRSLKGDRLKASAPIRFSESENSVLPGNHSDAVIKSNSRTSHRSTEFICWMAEESHTACFYLDAAFKRLQKFSRIKVICIISEFSRPFLRTDF